MAVAIGAAALVSDELLALRGSVVGLAVLCVIAVVVSQRAGRRQIASLQAEVDNRTTEVRALHIELDRVHFIHFELAGEVVELREQMADYVMPVPVTPDPIYPSLHLPLVRAAFAEELPTTTLRPQPLAVAESPNVEVEADSGSDTVPPRRLLDLTASEIARLRRASNA